MIRLPNFFPVGANNDDANGMMKGIMTGVPGDTDYIGRHVRFQRNGLTQRKGATSYLGTMGVPKQRTADAALTIKNPEFLL